MFKNDNMDIEGKGISWRRFIDVCLITVLILGLFDTLVIVVHELPRVSSISYLLIPVAARIGVLFLAYMVMWFLFVYVIVHVVKLDVMRLSAALSVFMIAVYTLLTVHSELSLGSFPRDLRGMSIYTGSTIVGLVFGVATYNIIKILKNTFFLKRVVRICFALPFIITEAMIGAWLFGYWGDSLGMVLSMLFIISLTISFVVTVVIFMRSTELRFQRIVLQALTFIIISSIFVVTNETEELGSVQRNSDGSHELKHVILITIDTLRQDALSCYGNKDDLTPCIDQLAGNGIRFKKSFASSPWTIPSVASIMTGLSPEVHMAVRRDSKVPYILETIAEYMLGDGYLTCGIGTNPVLRSNDFKQGFSSYRFFFPSRRVASLADKILLWLFPEKFGTDVSTNDLTNMSMDWVKKHVENDFFLWIHYFDPHSPYEPPEEYLLSKKPPPAMGLAFSGLRSIRGGYFAPSELERAWIRNLYDGEVRYVDCNVGILLDQLKKLKIYDKALIVLTSDHGEEFWDHGGYEHGHSLYNELLSVPLIIKLPQSSTVRVVDQAVSIDDIMPTILQLCKVNYDVNSVSGRSLVGLWGDMPQPAAPNPIVSTGTLYYENRESVVYDHMKYIRSMVSNKEELYDLQKDPGEQHNLAYISPEQLARGSHVLGRQKKKHERLKKHYKLFKGQEAEIDAKTLEQLKSLGYVE
jgi:arylsulfatase A-like enzyme